MLFALASICGVLLCGQPGTAPAPTDAHPMAKPAERSVVELSNDELIDRLPPACQESTRHTRSGDWESNPVVAEWQGRILAGKVTKEELVRALSVCGILRSSPTCFNGKPLHVWMRMPSWLPGETGVADPNLPGLKQVRTGENRSGMLLCGNDSAGQESEEAFQEVGVLPPGTTQVEFTVTIKPSEFFGGPSITHAFTVVLPVQLIPLTDPVPVADAETTSLVQKALGLSCSSGYFKEGGSAWINAWWVRPLKGPLTRTLVSVQTELLKDGRVLCSHVHPDPDEVYGEMAWDIDDSQFFRGAEAREIIEHKDLDHFSVRVKGVLPTRPANFGVIGGNSVPSNQWYRTQYWTGTFTVPLAELLEPESGMRPAGPVGHEGTDAKK